MPLKSEELKWAMFGSSRNIRHNLILVRTYDDDAHSHQNVGVRIDCFNGWRRVWKGTAFVGQERTLAKAKRLAEATYLLGE
jgi:hypothetical protein